jgi:hypothetical protein
MIDSFQPGFQPGFQAISPVVTVLPPEITMRATVEPGGRDNSLVPAGFAAAMAPMAMAAAVAPEGYSTAIRPPTGEVR